MSIPRTTQTLARIAAGLLGLVLFVAALGKTSPDQTIDALTTVLGVTDSIAWWLVVALVVIELTLGAALMTGVSLRAMLSVSAGLFIAFVGWTGYLWINDIPVDCGCGLSFTEQQEASRELHFSSMLRASALASVNIAALLGYLYSGPNVRHTRSGIAGPVSDDDVIS